MRASLVAGLRLALNCASNSILRQANEGVDVLRHSTSTGQLLQLAASVALRRLGTSTSSGAKHNLDASNS